MTAGQPTTGGPAGALPRYGETIYKLRENTQFDRDVLALLGNACRSIHMAIKAHQDRGDELTDGFIRSLLNLGQLQSDALVGWQYEWEECPDCAALGSEAGWDDQNNDACLTCLNTADYGLQPGQVPMECEVCEGTGLVAGIGDLGPDAIRELPCPFVVECLDGYRARRVDG